MIPHYLFPTWPAPANIKACTTLRMQGHSLSPYDSFNLSISLADDSEAVAKNRQQLCAELELKQEPVWVKQVHGVGVIKADDLLSAHSLPEADASYTAIPGVPCTVLTADCLPLLVCDQKGSQVAAIHAGWRGLAAGVIEATLDRLTASPEQLLVWLGPAIGPNAFEVGEDVLNVFMQIDPQAPLAFKSIAANKYLADIYQLAKHRLIRYGVRHIYGGEYCTYTDAVRFYSYRRDGEGAGRMASLIWIANF